jgi:hypothetical protein
MGNCADKNGTGSSFGRGRGAGRERGHGLGINRVQGNSWLQNQINDLQAAIQKLTERLDGKQ